MPFKSAQPMKKLAALAILVFSMSPLVTAQTESTIYSFKGGRDGASPAASLIADSAGNLYGTTSAGGGSGNCGTRGGRPVGCGTVFELTPPAQSGGRWTETILYVFQGGTADGVGPVAPLVFDAAGNLYGTTFNGGASKVGTIFELTPPVQQGGAWTESVLYTFSGGDPSSGLVFDPQGNLYGEAFPSNGSPQIFELSPPVVQGGSWTFNVLYTFATFAQGTTPVGGIVLDAGGNLYGTCAGGGTGSGGGCPGGTNCGLVFKLVKPATQGGAWTEKVLHNFTGTNGDGSTPESGVIFHNGNQLYGTTAYGGNGIGDGTVFELSLAAGVWTETTLYQFDRTISGFRPEGGVVFDRQGNLYSDTYFSLGSAGGEVFKLSPPAVQGNPWTLTNLYDFTCGNDGCYTLSRVIFGKGNLLYGTTGLGGIAGDGVVFRITP